jgi:hypothetical protein
MEEWRRRKRRVLAMAMMVKLLQVLILLNMQSTFTIPDTTPFYVVSWVSAVSYPL